LPKRLKKTGLNQKKYSEIIVFTSKIQFLTQKIVFFTEKIKKIHKKTGGC
jgi:hypothetical protein